MGAFDTPLPGIYPLDEAACFERLGQRSVARVALCWDALPEILPIQYALLGRDPVFRTIPGHKIMASAGGQILSLGIDDFDPDHQLGWHILVTGPAEHLTDPGDLAAAAALPLKPWAGNDDGFVRVTAARVRGTEIRDRGTFAPGASASNLF